MALWHLYRMETAYEAGPVSLTCLEGENPTKFTLYDSDTQTYDVTQACVPAGYDTAHVLTLLTGAGYTPNDWD